MVEGSQFFDTFREKRRLLCLPTPTKLQHNGNFEHILANFDVKLPAIHNGNSREWRKHTLDNSWFLDSFCFFLYCIVQYVVDCGYKSINPPTSLDSVYRLRCKSHVFDSIQFMVFPNKLVFCVINRNKFELVCKFDKSIHKDLDYGAGNAILTHVTDVYLRSFLVALVGLEFCGKNEMCH